MRSALPDPGAERQLLLGILALQNDFISQDAFLTAFRAWTGNRQQSFADVLCRQGALSKDLATLLSDLVDAHVRTHGSRADQSLSAMTILPEDLHAELQSMSDAELRESLSSIGNGELSLTLAMGQHTAAGRFHILRPHRTGGLGEVFVARDAELDREVALKQIRGTRSGDVAQRERFLREAEITGKLEHPGVVPVYGFGHDDEGAPYYAMRLIRGRSLKDAASEFHKKYADGNGDPSERNKDFRKLLGCFVDVCNAVEYAHSRGVLHRDLKPANVMLGRYGETLVVDWGLARVAGTQEVAVEHAAEPPLTSRLSGNSSETVAGTALGTPAFMSPEQAEGRLDLLGPASDVYSLGATLCVLLTGKPPLDGDPADMVKRATLGMITSPRELNPEVPAALDAICRRAMALRGSDRYACPAALAADIEAWLADEPVTVWQESRLARLRRWARRHQSEVSIAAAAVLVLTCTTCIWAWMLNSSNQQLRDANATVERQVQSLAATTEEAREARTRADNVRDYLVSAFRLTNPQQDGSTLTVAEVLDRSLEEMDERLGDDKLAQADLLEAVGNSYRGLGLYHRALDVFQRQYDLRQKIHPRNDPRTLTAAYQLALATHDSGDYDAALEMHEANIEGQIEVLGPEHIATLNSHTGLANSLRSVGRYQEARALYERLLIQHRRLHGDDAPGTMMAVNNLATALQSQGDFQRALALFEDNLERRRRVHGERHRNTWLAMDRLASIHNVMGNFDESVPLYNQAFEQRRQHMGADHPDTLQSMSGLAFAYRDAGDNEKACELLQAARVAKTRRYGAGHPVAINAINDLARIYLSLGRYAEALPLVEETESTARNSLGETNPKTLAARNTLGMTLYRLGRQQESVAVFESLLQVYESDYGTDHPTTNSIMNNLAMSYRDSGEIAKSLPLFNAVLDWRQQELGKDHPKTLVSMQNLAGALRVAGRLREANELAGESATLHVEVLGNEHRQSVSALSIRDQTQLALGVLRAGLQHAEETLLHARGGLGDMHPDTMKATDVVARFQLAAGRYEVANRLFTEVHESRQRHLGTDHAATLASRFNLGLLKQETRAEDSVSVCRAAAAALAAHHGEEHPAALRASCVLGRALLQEGELQEALKLLRVTHEQQCHTLGAGHPSTLETQYSLAEVLFMSEDGEAALELMRDTFRQRNALLGSTHLHTLQSQLKTATWMIDKGECEAAAAMLTAIWDTRQSRPQGDVLPREAMLDQQTVDALISASEACERRDELARWQAVRDEIGRGALP